MEYFSSTGYNDKLHTVAVSETNGIRIFVVDQHEENVF